MAITYTWLDAYEVNSLLYVDDSASPNIELQIPAVDGNRHYAEYLDWVAEGNTASSYTAPTISDDDPRTDNEKLEQSTGLTVAEIKVVLGIT